MKITLNWILVLLPLTFTACRKEQKLVKADTPELSEAFVTELPDGRYLVDSTDNVFTFAWVENKKIIKFEATDSVGKPSKTGYLQLRFVEQSLTTGEENPIDKQKNCYLMGCKWVCTVPISTTSTEVFCNCICLPKENQDLLSAFNSDFLGLSFAGTTVKETQIRLVLDL